MKTRSLAIPRSIRADRSFEAADSIFFVQSAIRLRILALPMPNRSTGAMDDDRAKRRQIFELLASRFGRIVPASSFKIPSCQALTAFTI